MARRYRNY